MNGYGTMAEQYARYGGGGMAGRPSGRGGGGGYNWMTDPNAPWNQLLNMGGLQDIRQSQIGSLQQQMKTMGGDLSKQIGKSWWGSGAGVHGIESSIPGQRYAEGYGNLMGQFYQPALANIEQQYMQGVISREDAARQMQFMAQKFKAEQEAGKKGFWDYFGDIAKVGVTAKMMFSCFADNTDIETDKGIVAMNELEEGDLVKTDSGYQPIIKVLKYNESPTLEINNLETTPTHPFVLKDNTIKLSGRLNIGDELYGNVKVTNIKPIRSNRSVMNLEVKGHKYYVSNILVHDGREVNHGRT